MFHHIPHHIPPVTEQEHSCNTTMFCFSSADPAAVNSTVLYDHYIDEGSLWFRNSTASPLQPCSPSWTQDLQCTVCLHDDKVFAMCRNLPDKVRMVMEAGAKSVSISKSDCPPPPPEDTQQWLLPVLITFIVIILLFAAIFICKRCRRCRAEQTGNEIQNNSQEMEVMTAEANEENQTPPLLMKPSCCVNGTNNGSPQQV